ncbi:MAG: hypothetical protein M3R45_10795 [Pseudomonadota bacterium]|nr:hypothetical protein [Pseudomonadota bacterium]
MSINQSFESAKKTMKSNAEKFGPGAAQEAFQPVMENMKAWGDLVQEQAQASQAAVAQTFEAFKNIKEPQAAFEVMSAFAQNLTAMFAKNIKDAVALSVAQFKGNVGALENTLPASDAVTQIANGLKDAASKMENSMESAVNDGAAAIKKARTE